MKAFVFSGKEITADGFYPLKNVVFDSLNEAKIYAHHYFFLRKWIETKPEREWMVTAKNFEFKIEKRRVTKNDGIL